LEMQLADPATPSKPARFKAVVLEHAHLRRALTKAGDFVKAERDLAAARELEADSDAGLKSLAADEIAALEPRMPVLERELMLALLPPDPVESRNTILEIRAGTGGDEAALFAGDLFRMYTRYAERRGWKVNIVDAASSDRGGFKEVVAMVQGDGAYGVLRYEGGVHRVQRVPETEAAGRIHTSAATVAVLPEAEEMDEIAIPAEELRIDIFCSSGPGGQSVNTTYSAVRVTHLPTGLVAQSQDERSQRQNKEKALTVLKSRLLDQRRREEQEKGGVARRDQIRTGDRSEKIRTYNFPQNRLTDHRINLTLYSLNRAIEGDLDSLLQALREDDLGARLRAQMNSPSSERRG
ncbi:MAG: peptide chain release factor 1, partial [bacterium]